MNDDVYVLGVGMHPFGRFGLPYQTLARTAATDALKDAGVAWPAVDAAFGASMYLPPTTGLRVLSALGVRGTSIVDVEAACASGSVALVLAAQALRAGDADIALALGVETRPRGFMDPAGIYEPWQVHIGLSQTPIYWALWAKNHMQQYGVTDEDIAAVSVKNHSNGVANPRAMYRKAVTLEDVLASPLVCDPLHLLELCAPNEGAAAVVLCSGRVVAQHTREPVKLAAAVHRTSCYPQRRAPAFSFSAKIIEESETATAACAAYEAAGVGPDDLDLVELQDADAFQEILYAEDLGLATRGEGHLLATTGVSAVGGRLPINVSGGLLSKGEPVGASALGQVVELVEQVRGQARGIQVEGAHTALAHVVGAGGNCGVTIIQR
jgi:acetyl-CoA acetyltransferase